MLGRAARAELAADVQLTQHQQSIGDLALEQARAPQAVIAMEQAAPALAGLAVDVSVDDVVIPPGEEVGLGQAREDGMAQILSETNPADVAMSGEFRKY